jgi:hypothetical protein
MITAVDTNVLADVFSGDPHFGRASAEALRRCGERGRLVACEVVFAECAAAFPDADAAADALARARVDFSELDPVAALAAGIGWGAYRRARGARERIAADFLIGEHARKHADQLLTRDRGFYRRYFDGLEILDPSAS